MQAAYERTLNPPPSQINAVLPDDDFLYAAVVDGWRGLPACTARLSEDQRWDIVNYFRTFEARPS